MTTELLALAERLPTPEDYFRGRRIEPPTTPQNLLLFLRHGFHGRQYSQHGRHVLIVCLAGPGELGIGGRILRLTPGQAALVLPYRPHYFLTRDTPLRWLFVTFELAVERDLQGIAGRPLDLAPLDLGLLTELAQRFLAGASPRGRLESSVGALALATLLARLEAQRPAPESRARPSAATPAPEVEADPESDRERLQLYAVIQRIYRELDRLPPIAGLAADVGMSASHLRACFRRLYGVSLGQFIRDARLQEAARLLRLRDLRVGEVAGRVGFASAFAFSRAFKHYTGAAPRDYRRQARDESAGA